MELGSKGKGVAYAKSGVLSPLTDETNPFSSLAKTRLPNLSLYFMSLLIYFVIILHDCSKWIRCNLRAELLSVSPS